MSETRRSLTYDFYVRCDTPGCQQQRALRIFPGAPLAQREEEEEFLRSLAEQGWTVWVGARTRRNYCPDHKPHSKSRMRDATPARGGR